MKPSVYRDLCNLIDRRHEGAVLDAVRRRGLRFVAHAGGFLHGVLTSGRVKGTRFAEGNILSMDARRYDTEKHHAAVRAVDELLAKRRGGGSGISKTDVAVHWLAFHSELKPSDAIIFGGSKIAQVKATVAAVAEGPLPDDTVVGPNKIWSDLSAAS